MEKLSELGSIVIIRFGDFELTLSQTIILAVSIIALLLLSTLSTMFLRKSKALASLGDRLKKLIIRSVNYLIWIIGLIVLLKLQDVDTKSFFAYTLFAGDKVNITIQKIFMLVVIIFIVRLIVVVFDFLMNRKIERDHIDYGKGQSLLQIMRYLIWIAGIIIGLSAIDIKITFFIASISALLVGVGFGLQHIFNDFFSGIIILFDGSIKVNDVVQVGDVVGEVKEIGMRATKIRNRDNIVLIIPNSKFTSDNVINWSLMDHKTRFNVEVGVAYGSDVRLVESVLLQCANEVKDIERKPQPFVRFEDFGDSALIFKIFFWTRKSFYVENTRSDLRFFIDQKFRENNITIPFPQRDIHVKSGNV
jgi:small-conductance mechanosensitive channel